MASYWISRGIHGYVNTVSSSIKANSLDTAGPFLDLVGSITNGRVSSKICRKIMILILKL